MTVTKTAKVYDIIDKKAGSNQFLQGLSGTLGFPFTVLADGAVIFTHYGPMINEIRDLYGREPISANVLGPILKGASSEILSDVVFDKLIGQIPIVGIASNVMCAKAMTWRLGLLFAMISARGEEVNANTVRRTCILIRKLFPQSNTFVFRQPSVTIVEKLLNVIENEPLDGYEEKIERLLANL